MPAGWLLLYAGVDDEGRLVPYLETYREWQARLAGSEEYGPAPACRFSLISAGEIDPALKDALRAAQCEIRAQYAPPVPAWIRK